MKVIKIILLAAMTMALTITLSMKILYQQEQKLPFTKPERKPPTPSHRLSRFLVESDRNPRAADHCHKDNETCSSDEFGANATCCNNKCVELATDRMNCGACKNKCKYTYSCCRGECVDLAFDKRHCGKCNNRCMPNGFCIYGMCDYA